MSPTGGVAKVQLPGFYVTGQKGFHVTFANGWTVSVQFGGGNYCDNREDGIGGAVPGPQGDKMNILEQFAKDAGGKIESVSGPLPDGSGFAVMSMPLPTDHWLTAEGRNEPPMPFRMGQDDSTRMNRTREMWVEDIRAAARYAIRASTDNGKIIDFDPDAMVQNMVVGLIGYFTPDGLSHV